MTLTTSSVCKQQTLKTAKSPLAENSNLTLTTFVIHNSVQWQYRKFIHSFIHSFTHSYRNRFTWHLVLSELQGHVTMSKKVKIYVTIIQFVKQLQNYTRSNILEDQALIM